jgi:hypothetical protein
VSDSTRCLGSYSPEGGAASVAIGIIGLVLYFVPFIVALLRKTPNVGSVFVINLFLGWTVIGWIIALAMAAGSSQSRVVAVQMATPPMPPAAGRAPTFVEIGSRYRFGYTLDPAAYAIWDGQAPGPPIERFPYSEHGKSEALEKYRALEQTTGD